MDDMFGQQAPAEQGEGGEDPFGASTAAVDDPSAGFMGVESAPPLGEGGDMGGFAAEPLPGSDSAGGDAFGGMGGDMPASMGEQNGGADLAAFGGGGADDIMGGAGGDAGGMGGSMGDLGMMGDGMPDMSAPPPDMGAPPPQPAMTQDYEPSAVAYAPRARRPARARRRVRPLVACGARASHGPPPPPLWLAAASGACSRPR